MKTNGIKTLKNYHDAVKRSCQVSNDITIDALL